MIIYMFFYFIFFFFFNDTATTEIYTLSLHDALPISVFMGRRTSAERILLLAAVGGGRLLRRFPQRRSVLALRFLRTGDRAEVFSHRDLRIQEQGIRRDEADTVFFLRRHVCF